MNHMDEGLLQAYADEELAGHARTTVEGHLGTCLSCHAELDELRSASEELTRGLLLLSDPQAEIDQYAVGWPRRPGAKRLTRMAALPRAAVLVLALGTAAAAMIPGSPVYRLINPAPRAAQVESAAPPSAAQPIATSTAAAAAAAPAEAGVSIEPLNGEVRVVLRAGSELRVRASIASSPRAGVFATGAAAQARFDASPGRIEVTGAESGDLRIEMPRGAVTTVMVNGRDYLRSNDGEIQLFAPADSRADAEVTFHP